MREGWREGGAGRVYIYHEARVYWNFIKGPGKYMNIFDAILLSLYL